MNILRPRVIPSIYCSRCGFRKKSVVLQCRNLIKDSRKKHENLIEKHTIYKVQTPQDKNSEQEPALTLIPKLRGHRITIKWSRILPKFFRLGNSVRVQFSRKLTVHFCLLGQNKNTRARWSWSPLLRRWEFWKFFLLLPKKNQFPMYIICAKVRLSPISDWLFPTRPVSTDVMHFFLDLRRIRVSWTETHGTIESSAEFTEIPNTSEPRTELFLKAGGNVSGK